MKRVMPFLTIVVMLGSLLLPVVPLSGIPNPTVPDAWAEEPGGVPGWPVPAKPIPHHEPGHLSRAESYTTQVLREDEMGVQQLVEISGLEAMAADGLDPFAGNYTMVNMDKIMTSWNVGDQQSVQTLDSTTMDTIPGSRAEFDNYRSMDIAGGDLNNDGQAEQIAAWLDPADNHIRMSIGEMPGSLGRTTSAPAAIARSSGWPSGYALQFDGLDDYVDGGGGIDEMTDHSFTVAFWTRRDSAGRHDIVVAQGTMGTQNQGLHIGFRDNDKFTCAFWDNDLDTDEVYTDTDWHHWACTYDAGTKLRTIYRDGVQVAQDSKVEPYQGTGGLWIGRYLDGAGYAGVIDQVGIWATARTPQQIQADLSRPAPDETGLVAYWPFDEGTGTTTADASDNGNTGTLVNEPHWLPLGDLHLLARGYDEALWHGVYDLDSGRSLGWDNSAGGTLLSAPAVASLADGQFDAFAVQTDTDNGNDVYRRHWQGGWVGDWQLYADWPHAAPEWTGATPELPPLAVVARAGGFDLFRLGPDNTLRWFNGTSWLSLGGMLASGPGAVSLGADHMQVFARGVDETLWHRTCGVNPCEGVGDWGPWQRLELAGMDEGVTIASAPAAVSPASGPIEVYVRGSDDQLWKRALDASEWVPLGGSLASGVAVAAGSIFSQADDGSLQHGDGAVWTSLGGLPPRGTVQDTGLVAALKDVYPYEDYSVDVETGYFLGDGRSQIAVAYEEYSSGVVKTTLFQTIGGFELEPVELGEVTIPHDVDWFKIATGDFLDGDGLDEVALAYVHAQSYGVDIVRLSSAGSEVAIEGEPETDGTECGWSNSMWFAGTLEAVSGDLDADGQDEIATTVLLYCEDWQTSTLPDCLTYRYHARTRIFDILEDQEANAYNLEGYYIEESYRREAAREANVWTVGLSLASGDVTGDGKDEIIRTWPHRFLEPYNACIVAHFADNDKLERKLEVWSLDRNPDPSTNVWDEDSDSVIDEDSRALLNDPPDPDFVVGATSRSYAERLVVGDLDRDLKGEPVWQIATNDDRILRRLDYSVPDEGDPRWDWVDVHLPFVYYPNMVAGDFTGEGLRVGPPNYRRQYSVGRIAAIINAPPKHVDFLNGVEYDINASDSETLARLSQWDGKTTDVSLTTKRDWGLSATFETTIGSPEASHTTNSLTTTYGGNFSKTTGNVTTFEIQQTSAASADDALFYIRTDYDVWEYPVLVDPTGTAADYISVVFPVSGPRLRVERGNTCDSWYQPRHQLDNVWSYPSKAEQLVDRDEAGSGDLVTSSDYLVSEDDRSFTVNWGVENVTKQTSGFELGFANEFEWQIGGEELSFEIAGFGFSARLPSFKFSSKANYDYAQLAEWEVTTTNNTEVFGYLNGLPPGSDAAGYDYAVWPYLYWAEGGYLMLDYATSPEGSFWTKYDKPDPAFTLPWADGQCNTAEDPNTELFTRDILVDPPVVSAGDPVTLTATVRNFSEEQNTQAFDVTFYLGDPDAGGTKIGDSQTIGAYDLGPRAVATVTTHWTAAGSGDQRIYAVIDPSHQLAEVHDETDPDVNNNKGYALVHMGALDFVDMGEAAEKHYYPIAYGLSQTMQASLFVPVGNLAENTRFDLQDADLAVPGIAGKAFQLLVYRGKDNWDTPEQEYSFQPDTDHPPAVMLLSYGDADIAGMDEANLTLYRLDTGNWQEATCPNYDVQRFPAENLLAVPLCNASIFALSDETPEMESHIYLPLVLRSAP